MKKTIFLTLVIAVLLLSCGKKQNPVVVVDKNARFTIISDGLIRMEYSDSGKFIDDKSLFAIHRNVLITNFSLEQKDGKTTIKTSKMELVYMPNGKPFSESNLQISLKTGATQVSWKPGDKNKQNLGGTLRTLDGVSKEVTLPEGLLSRDGWYLIDDSKRPLFTEDWVKSRPQNSGFDWYFFAYGTDYKSALKDLTSISGKIPLPRKYSFGSWYSRYWPYSSQDYKDLIKEYHENDFPLDIMVMDMDWHKDGWTGWSWNRKLLPDAEELQKFFDQNNIAVTMNTHPADGVKPHEDMYKAFMQEMGVDLGNHPDSVIPFDASNKKYIDALFKHTHADKEDQGVDFWWLDWQQYENSLGNPDLKNLEWLNDYYFKFSERKGNRGLSFSRWGGWGQQRYPMHFSGDADSRWPMLKFEVPFTSVAGNVGCFFWTHDIGGHMGGAYPETATRWVQFGALSAALRLHSTRDPKMDKRPWIYEKVYLESQKIAFHLRSEIFPYLYTSAWQSVEESLPFISPMYIEYPEKEMAYQNPQQYFLGNGLLVAPIVSPGIGERKIAQQNVWFPDGVWYNWFTNEKYLQSDALQTVMANIDEIPLFAKGGSIISMQAYTERMASAQLNNLFLRTYPGIDGKTVKSVLYEDDGISKEYQNKAFALTDLSYVRKGTEHIIKIEIPKGKFKGQVEKRAYTIQLAATQKASSASVDGKNVSVQYDESKKMNIISIPEKAINTGYEIKITAAELDNEQIIKQVYKRHISEIFGKDVDITATNMVEIVKREFKPEYVNQVVMMLAGISLDFTAHKFTLFKNLNSSVSDEIKISVENEIVNQPKQVLQNETIILKAGEYKSMAFKSPDFEWIGLKSQMIMNIEFTVSGNKFVLNELIKENEGCILNWNLIGPFQFNSAGKIEENVFEPEKNLDLNAKYKGKNDQNIAWTKVAASDNFEVLINELIPEFDAIAYGLVYIKSENDQPVEFFINSDDGVEFWVNDSKIHSLNAARNLSETDHVKGKLHKGINTLLIKVSQGGGGWGYKVKLKTSTPIKASVNKDKL